MKEYHMLVKREALKDKEKLEEKNEKIRTKKMFEIETSELSL